MAVAVGFFFWGIALGLLGFAGVLLCLERVLADFESPMEVSDVDNP